jgi:hypothetical protein
MVHFPFKLPESDDSIKYSVGQPMGARSSWAVFALTHHILIRYCAHLLGKSKFSHYMVLGDDVVINNNRVAKLYQKYLAKLGVDCSEAKTHISNNRYEFAKRWIKPKEKVEVTGSQLVAGWNFFIVVS